MIDNHETLHVRSWTGVIMWIKRLFLLWINLISRPEPSSEPQKVQALSTNAVSRTVGWIVRKKIWHLSQTIEYGHTAWKTLQAKFIAATRTDATRTWARRWTGGSTLKMSFTKKIAHSPSFHIYCIPPHKHTQPYYHFQHHPHQHNMIMYTNDSRLIFLFYTFTALTTKSTLHITSSRWKVAS